MKQITNKEFEEWQKYKAEKANGHILPPDTVRFICEANYVYTDEGLGFAYISTASKYYEQPKEQYRIASRQKLYTYSFYRYGTPYWSESQVSSDNVKLVSTRLLFTGTACGKRRRIRSELFCEYGRQFQ